MFHLDSNDFLSYSLVCGLVASVFLQHMQLITVNTNIMRTVRPCLLRVRYVDVAFGTWCPGNVR